MGNLTTPGGVQKLRAALHAKAKAEPGYRFYLLYDKVYRKDVLEHAYLSSKANGGAVGVDGQGFADIEAYGRERWLGELAERLRKKEYRANAVRRVYIPKANGKLRPLGIPTITDRVVQTAALLILEPIFEADLAEEQHGYRPERSALTAVREVHRLLNRGHTEVVDADVADFFGSIPHAELMTSVARRVSDKHLLHLIKMWLDAPVIEDGGPGGPKISTQHRDEGRGTPQGAPISPLLSNLYMRRFILGWKRLGYEARYGARIVAYADDFVILCRHRADEALAAMRRVMERLKLTVNEDKTHLCRVPDEHFDFLGYTFGRCYSKATGRAYLGTRPSRKSVSRVQADIRQTLDRGTTWKNADDVVQRLGRSLRGWANYFCLGPVSPAYRAIDQYAASRLRRWLCVKHKVRGQGTQRFPDDYLYQTLGLIHLAPLTKNLPWANA